MQLKIKGDSTWNDNDLTIKKGGVVGGQVVLLIHDETETEQVTVLIPVKELLLAAEFFHKLHKEGTPA